MPASIVSRLILLVPVDKQKFVQKFIQHVEIEFKKLLSYFLKNIHPIHSLFVDRKKTVGKLVKFAQI